MDIQELITKATVNQKMGEDREALQYYNQAFEALTDEAANYAHMQPFTVKDGIDPEGKKVRTILPRYFEVTKTYLKRDETVYIVLKNMAVIYHKSGDINSAINALEQAIELAPDGHDVSDAQNGLDNLK